MTIHIFLLILRKPPSWIAAIDVQPQPIPGKKGLGNKVTPKQSNSYSCGSDDLPALNDPYQHNNDCDNDQNVNKPTHGVTAHHPEQPQN
jgi:hypothetical protein